MVQLLITFDPNTKQLQVQGPIHDRMLAYSMLSMAYEVILKQALAAEQNSIVPANGNDISHFRR